MIFPNKTPPAVPTQNAVSPRITTLIVSHVIKVSPEVVAPTTSPNIIVITDISPLLATSARRLVQPASYNKLPNINIPTKVPAEGKSKETITVTATGNTIFSNRDTCLSCSILTIRCSLVVNAFIIGG